MRKVLSALASTLFSTPLALLSLLWNLFLVVITLSFVVGGITLVRDLMATFDQGASVGNVAASAIAFALIAFISLVFTLAAWASLDMTRDAVRKALDDVRNVADTARAVSDEHAERADTTAAQGGRLSMSAPSHGGELSETRDAEGHVTLAIEDDEEHAAHEHEHVS